MFIINFKELNYIIELFCELNVGISHLKKCFRIKSKQKVLVSLFPPGLVAVSELPAIGLANSSLLQNILSSANVLVGRIK